MRKRLGGFIARRIVDALDGPDIMEAGVEIRKIKAHLDASIEDADFGQFLRPVISDLGLGRFEFAGGVPGSAMGIVEPPSGRARMAVSRHNDGRMWPGHPLRLWNPVQHAHLCGDAVIGPGFELEDVREILRARDTIENAAGGVAAGDQAAAIFPADSCNRRRSQRRQGSVQLQPPRRESISRRTW